MVNAIGGLETAATGTIEIVRVTPVGIGKAPSCQGADCGPQPGGPAPAAVQPIGHRDAETMAPAIWEAEWSADPTPWALVGQRCQRHSLPSRREHQQGKTGSQGVSTSTEPAGRR